jgi:hypothetical protein
VVSNPKKGVETMSNYDDGTRTSGTPAMAPPPPQQMPMHPGYGYGMSPYGMRIRRSYPTETKPFFLTSEFALSVIVSIAIAITAASSHAFGAWRAWILITAVMVSYNLARGIAKSGTRSNASDPREDLDLNWGRGNSENQHQS